MAGLVRAGRWAAAQSLAEAMRLSGAKTKKETVNVALREFAGL
jgi:Arc/MetJ family transcription regulator